VTLRLHLVTDWRRLSGESTPTARGRSCLRQQFDAACRAGIDVIQIRESWLPAAALAALVTEAVATCRGSETRVVVNDRLDIALACGAAGVHLRADSLSAAAARSLAPPGFLIGRSVHGADEVPAAADAADYLIAGTVWPTVSKSPSTRWLGLDGLARVTRVSPVPVLAIGGVTSDRFGVLASSGATGAAGIGLFMGEGTDGCRVVSLDGLTALARGLTR
jgi:thiamine-phosphate pyrophosphorylase